MTQIGQATLQIIPSLRGVSSAVSRELSGVGQAGGAAASGGFTSKFLSGIGGLAKKATKTGIAVGTAFATAAGISGFSRLMALEEAEASLSSMGISAERADVLMEALNTTLTGTPYALSDGATAMSGFVSAGLGLDKIPKAMDLVTDAAAFGKAEFSEVSDIFQKVVLNGGATTMMLQQLQYRGIPAFALLSDAAGMTGAEFQKFVSDGNLSTEEFFRLWEKGAAGFGESNIQMAGAAQNAGKVVRGAWGNVKSAVARIGATFLKPIYEALPGAMAAITGHLNEVREKIEFAIERLIDSGALSAAWDLITAKAGVFRDAISNIDWSRIDFAAVGEAISSTASAVADALTPLGPAIADVATSIGEQIGPVLEHLADAFQTAAPWVAEVATAIGQNLAGAVSAVAPHLPTVAGLVSSLVDLVTKVPAPVVAGIATAIGGIWAGKAVAQGTVSAISKVAGKLGSIKTSATNAATSVSKLWNSAATKSGYSAIDRLRLAAMGAQEKVGKLAAGAANFAKSALGAAKQAGAWATAQLSAAAASVKATAATVAQAAKQAILTAAQKAASVAQWALNAAMNANPIMLIVAAVAALVAGFVLAYQKIDWFRDAVDAVGRAIAAVASWIAEAVGGIISWISDAVSTAAEFISGIVETVVDVVGGVISWIRENWDLLLGILTGPIGLAVVAITRHWDTIKQAIGTAVGWVTDKLSTAWAAISGTVSTVWSTISGTISGIWSSVTSNISSAVSTVKTTLSNAWDSVIERVKSFNTDIIGFFKRLPGHLVRGLRNLVSMISAPFRAAGQAIKNAWNSTIGGKGVTVPDIPGLPGRGQRFEIPRFHTGGIVGMPGLSGDEVVAKVLRGEWILQPGQVAALAGAGAGGGQHLHFHGPVTMDGARWVAEQTRRAQKAGLMPGRAA